MTDAQRRDLVGRGMAVAYWASVAPDRPAVVSDHAALTFGDLNRRANQLVRALRRRGLVEGDAVALMARNRPEWVEVWAACQRAGWRLTPVNWHFTSEEAEYIVDDCGARAFISDAAVPAADAVDTPHVAARLVIGRDYDDAVAGEDGVDIDHPTLGNTMIYTSGTTGRPKGVARPPAPPPELPQYRGEEHLHLCTGPLYHAAPYLVSMVMPLTNGVGVVLMDKWDPEETLRLIHEHRITHSHMVPTMFHRLLGVPADVRAKYDVSSLRYVIHGAAPCPVAVKQAVMDWWGPIVHEYYSSTEGLGTVVDPDTWLRKPGTVGRPHPADQVKIGDEDANPVSAGDVGLVWIKAPSHGRFRYYHDDAKTERSYRGDYFTLGDMGYLDDDGYLFLTDRSAELIISGGVNVYPAEVDAVLIEHPAVEDVAVIGVPNEEWGEEVKAVVQLRAGWEPSRALASELVDHCRSRLAAYKCPRSVDFVDELPRHDTGKIYKRLLRDEYRRKAHQR